MTRSKGLSVVLAAVLLPGVITVQPVSGRTGESLLRARSLSPEKAIVGTWQTRVRPRDCATGVVLDPGLRGLFSFHQGGTISEYGIGPGFTPALQSPGHGRWQREPGWSVYVYAFTYYRYDPLGQYVGQTRVRSVLELGPDGDAFVANSTVELFDQNDASQGGGCAQAVGTRFE
jgi:hypothetical protein